MKTIAVLILWFILFAVSWPLAIMLIFILPVLWLLLLPFRIIGFTLELVLEIVQTVLMLPFRILRSL